MAMTHSYDDAPTPDDLTEVTTTTPASLPIGTLLAAGAVALLGAVWFRSRRDEAALRERTAERLRPRREGN